MIMLMLEMALAYMMILMEEMASFKNKDDDDDDDWYSYFKILLPVFY